MAKVLDIGATSKIYNSSESTVEADRIALSSDWEAVGDDMRKALKDYGEQTTRKTYK